MGLRDPVDWGVSRDPPFFASSVDNFASSAPAARGVRSNFKNHFFDLPGRGSKPVINNPDATKLALVFGQVFWVRQPAL